MQEQRTASAEVRHEEAHVDDLQQPGERRSDIDVEEGEARRAPRLDEGIKKY